MSDELNLARTFVCKRCEKRFENKSELKMHMRKIHDLEEWKLKLLNKEKTEIGLKIKISSGLYELKEKGAKTKYVCQCKGFCELKQNKLGLSCAKLRSNSASQPAHIAFHVT